MRESKYGAVIRQNLIAHARDAHAGRLGVFAVLSSRPKISPRSGDSPQGLQHLGG